MAEKIIEPDGYETDRYQIDGPPPRYDSAYEISGNAYAWGKTARILTEDELLKSLADTDGDFYALDLCSSYPYYRQMMIGRHRGRIREMSRQTVGEFTNQVLYLTPNKNPLEVLKDFSPEELMITRNMLGPKRSRARELLHNVVFEIATNPPPSNDLEEQRNLIQQLLLSGFYDSSLVQTVISEPSGKMGDKGNWKFITSHDVGVTMAQELKSQLGHELTARLLDAIAGNLADRLAGNLKPETYISLDRAPLSSLVTDAQYCFPPRILNTRFFVTGEETNTHVRGDLNSLPFREGSISFISCIEGWPFYGGDQNEGEKIKAATSIASLLKPGGKAVFFPWEIKREDMDTPTNIYDQETQLRKVEKELAESGYIIEKQGYTRDELMKQMSDRELLLTDHSPVFTKGDGILTKVTITRPRHDETSPQHPML